MRWGSNPQRKINDINRITMFPNIKSNNFQTKGLSLRNCIEISLDERNYRATSRNIFKKMTTKNQSELDYLRATFMKQNDNQQKSKKTLGKYTIIKEIGKGGFAQVYEVEDQNKKKYAVKQYNLSQSSNCFYNQVKVGQFFYQKGHIRQQFEGYQETSQIVKFIEKFRIGKYGYIVQQLCEQNLSKILSEIQGVFHNNQRIYQIRFKQLYHHFTQKNSLKKILLQLCKAINFINSKGFIHCDLKLQNLMIEYRDNQPCLKIIDFGSTFILAEGLPKITITPQYMPPQLLVLLENGSDNYQILSKIDVWSIGCILLQILTGIPLWFRYKCKLQMKGRQVIQLGIFALSGRQYSKIIKRQKQLCENLSRINFTSSSFQKFRPVLKHLLTYDQEKRISLSKCIQQLESMD